MCGLASDGGFGEPRALRGREAKVEAGTVQGVIQVPADIGFAKLFIERRVGESDNRLGILVVLSDVHSQGFIHSM